MNIERLCYGCFQEKEPGIPCPHCGFNEKDEQPYLALPLGTILNGRYLIGKVLGIGGFGITYLGYDLTLEIKVAIKEYMPSALATRHPDHYSVALTGRVEEDYQYGMERFLDEAKILAKLQNTPNIVSVQNYFKENGTAYFVMEYIDGMSLKAYLAKNGDKIPYNQAIAILQPIMQALVQVHAMNLLHRDISPDNIYITSKGESRLLDFGAARFALGDGKSVSVILKHGYAPEEQYSSHGNQGPWTDVYAMGATMYRCITGQLPPDSVERIHGDTLKKPSELGFRIPANVENAIMKALAVKTEDRFSNMESFINALNGRVSVQEQVAASISQRTQATMYNQQPAYGQTAYQQPSYNGGSAPGRPSVFSRLLTYMKANPIIAWVSGGGLLAVIALCIILPIMLSGGGKTTTTTGTGGGKNTPIISQPPVSTQSNIPESSAVPELPTEPVVEMVKQDLGVLSATIDVPSDYTVSEDGFTFITEDKGCIIVTSYSWDMGGAIYSLADVESQRESIVSNLMQTLEVSNYQILASGPDQVGSRPAYQIYFEGTDSEGVSMDLVIMAVEGYEFGCYFIITAYPKGDEAAEAEIYSIIQSFESTGAPQTTYKMYYGTKSGVKVILDDAVAQGRVVDTTVNLGDAGAVAELIIYPTQAAMDAGFGSATPDSGIVEIGNAGQMGITSREQFIENNRNMAASLGASVGDNYTTQAGGVEWLCVDWTMNEFTFSSAAAMINGKCYAVTCMFNDSNKDIVLDLFGQALLSIRPWEG